MYTICKEPTLDVLWSQSVVSAKYQYAIICQHAYVLRWENICITTLSVTHWGTWDDN